MKTRFTTFAVAVPPLLTLVALLMGCRSQERVPQDETVPDPLLERVELVDIAVLKPTVQSSMDTTLSQHAREECRKILIERKLYSVPSDRFVDQKLSGRKPDPNQSAGVLGSDAVLEVVITEWDSRGLIPKGQVFAAGQLTLYGTGKSLWRRTFKDRKCLATTEVTSSNRAGAEGEVMRALVRDLLSNLPSKRAR